MGIRKQALRWIWAGTFLASLSIATVIAAVAPVRGGESSTAILRQTPDGRKLVLTFADEFDSFRPIFSPGGVWRTTFGDGSAKDLNQRTIRNNGELQVYVDRAMSDGSGPIGVDPFAVRAGALEITAARAQAAASRRLQGYGFTSGVISSQPSFSQKYGYFEMRATLPQGKGLWPAFWLLPADQSWPPEIDIMESIGDPRRVYMTAHSITAKAKGVEVKVPGSGFHTFAVSWEPTQLIWFVDGAEVGRQPTPPDMNKPMYILANLAIGGGWAGAPDASTQLPARFTIDFIRAYRFVS